MTVTTTASCPRCLAPLPGWVGRRDRGEAGGASLEPERQAPVVVCDGCGLPISTTYLTEYLELLAWQASATERLTWLHQHMLSGDLPLETFEGMPQTLVEPPEAVEGEVAGARRRPATAGSLLLAVGAFLLVAAGIAFIAFTWDLLGPFGQIAVLLALGAGCLAASARLSASLHGTAVAIGVVGALLVSIAALGARFLGPDVVGGFVSLVAAVAILAGLVAAGRWIRPRTAGVGELAAGAGALLAVALVAMAPVDEAIPLRSPWGWWSALWLLGGAVLLLVLADRMTMRTWPWIGAFYLTTGSLAFAGWVTDVVHRSADGGATRLLFATAMAALVVVAAFVLPRMTKHLVPVLAAVLVVWSLSLGTAWVTGVSVKGPPLWSALVLVGVGALGLLLALTTKRHELVRLLVALVGSLGIASAVGVAIPPYVEAQFNLDPRVWAVDAWPPWRGLVAGLAVVAVMAVASAVGKRLAEPLSSPWICTTLPLLLGGAALGTWLVAAQADLVEVTTPAAPYGGEYGMRPTPDAFVRQIAVALLVVAVATLVMALVRRLASWGVWLAPVLAVPAVLMLLSTVTVDSPLEPELTGFSVTLPVLGAATAWWWLRRPEPTPTWQTMAPPFVLGVLPSTLALLEDTTDRWWYGEDPSTAYQVRMVALIVVAAVAAVVGARQRWSGLFFPGLALAVVIVTVELVDLGRVLPQWVSFGLAGAALVAAGARWEWIRNRGREGAAWVRGLH